MFNIEKDSLITKHTFIKRSGVSRTTLDKYLKLDPNPPEKHDTPIGEMFLASEVSTWLSKLSEKMQRKPVSPLDNQASNS